MTSDINFGSCDLQKQIGVAYFVITEALESDVAREINFPDLGLSSGRHKAN
jgi:hypothetical protein